MSIEITGTFNNGKSPRVLHEGNRFHVKTVIASSEAVNYPGTSADLGNTVDRWKPFANLLTDPSNFNGDDWTATNVTVGADGQSVAETVASGGHDLEQAVTWDSGGAQAVFSIDVERQTLPEIRLLANDGTNTRTCWFDLRDLTIGSTFNATGEIISLGGGRYRLKMYFTANSATGRVEIQFGNGSEITSYGGDVNNTVKILRAAAHSGEATLRYDLFGDAAGDCIGIAAHNLGSGGARIQIEHDSNDDDTFTVIDTLEPTDDSPILFFFNAITSSRWRITIDRGALPEVGVFRVGAALEFQRAFYGGFTVPRMDRNTEVIGNLSGSGQLLGRSKKRTTLNANYSWENLTYSWVRANLDGPTGLIQSMETGPAFVAWRPSLTEDVEYLMRASVTAPQAQGTADLHSFQMRGEAHAYE